MCSLSIDSIARLDNLLSVIVDRRAVFINFSFEKLLSSPVEVWQLIKDDAKQEVVVKWSRSCVVGVNEKMMLQKEVPPYEFEYIFVPDFMLGEFLGEPARLFEECLERGAFPHTGCCAVSGCTGTTPGSPLVTLACTASTSGRTLQVSLSTPVGQAELRSRLNEGDMQTRWSWKELAVHTVLEGCTRVRVWVVPSPWSWKSWATLAHHFCSVWGNCEAWSRSGSTIYIKLTLVTKRE